MSACACMRQQGNMSSNQGLPRVCTLGQQGKVFFVRDDTPWQLIHACRARAGVPAPKETLDTVTRLRREAKAEREAKANANANKAKANAKVPPKKRPKGKGPTPKGSVTLLRPTAAKRPPPGSNEQAAPKTPEEVPPPTLQRRYPAKARFIAKLQTSTYAKAAQMRIMGKRAANATRPTAVKASRHSVLAKAPKWPPPRPPPPRKPPQPAAAMPPKPPAARPPTPPPACAPPPSRQPPPPPSRQRHIPVKPPPPPTKAIGKAMQLPPRPPAPVFPPQWSAAAFQPAE